MRWQNLTIDAAESTQLPGYRDAAVVRRFDAPEALDTRFYEVYAKSALNRVPERSRMPFRWTINPYRGCTHACNFCVSGDTLVLMADGSQRPISKLRRGDAIYGTECRGRYRRFTRTTVLAHWSSIKPACRVTLADGTELIASGDHRFLTGRGWKHVTGAMGGPGQRPHLTPNDEMLGFGAVPGPQVASDDYKRGYLCGMLRGDAHLGPWTSNSNRKVATLRLALADPEALDRSDRYLAEFGIFTARRAFSAGNERRRPIDAISAGNVVARERVQRVIAWPTRPSDEWQRGFLAGIFDAEGSCSQGVWRLSNKDDWLVNWTVECLENFGFRVSFDTVRPNGVVSFRILGGLPERMRFLALTDPAITRKRDIEGAAIKNDADLRVASIESLGTAMRMYDITTGTEDFIANGVVSHNCFARPTHTYLDFDAGRDFEREIVVKVNAPEVARAELMKPTWKREHVAMGTNTDPYQWVEGRYKLMPPIWEAMRDSATPCSILTKSPLVLRDLPKLLEVAEVAPVHANLSIPTMEEKAWRATEPRTPNPRARMEAVKALNDAGVPTGVLVAPLMPGINDDPRQVEAILAAALEAGVTSVGGQPLFLRGEVKDVFLDWLRSARPDLVDRYDELYGRGAYVPQHEAERLRALLRRPGVPPSRFRAMESSPRPAAEPPAPRAPRPKHEQTSLF